MSHLPNEDGGLGWKPHWIRQGDGHGGWVLKDAQCQILRYRERGWTAGFGVAQMDNGEIALLGTCDVGKSVWYGGGEGEKTIIAFSKDGGNSWTELEQIGDLTGRPMMLATLGHGRLTFVSDGNRYFSSDYGRTWSEVVPIPNAVNGGFFGTEGNPLVEYDAQGDVARVAEIGYNFGPPGEEDNWPEDPSHGFIRWSYDGGWTWTDEVEPQEWRWQETYEGKTYTRGVSEGSLVRAANGWLVAALRTDMPVRYLDQPNDDSLEGTGVSVSEDNGKTWTPIKLLFDAGRHHAHLLAMPNGDIVMTVTVRDDVRDGKLASYRRGCEAIVSHDNGLTWDLDHRYVLDEFEFYDAEKWYDGECGHLYSTLLDDGSVLTVHNNYLTMGMTLIKWRP